MNTYIYTYIHTYIHWYIHTYTRTYINTRTNTNINILISIKIKINILSHSYSFSVDPNLVKLHLRQGRALLRLGHLTHANEAYSKACDDSTDFKGFSSIDIIQIRTDGKNGLKSVLSARSAIRRLGQLESRGDHIGALNLLSDLSSTCPCCLLVLTAKCRALCKLERWNEAKEFAEQFACYTHVSILKLAAHPHIVLPGPTQGSLIWEERIGKNIVNVDTEAVVQILLSMGTGLSEVYLLALKNLDLNRNCSADIMTRIAVILDELSKYLQCTSHFHSSSLSAATGTVAGDLGEHTPTLLLFYLFSHLIHLNNN